MVRGFAGSDNLYGENANLAIERIRNNQKSLAPAQKERLRKVINIIEGKAELIKKEEIKNTILKEVNYVRNNLETDVIITFSPETSIISEQEYVLGAAYGNTIALIDGFFNDPDLKGNDDYLAEMLFHEILAKCFPEKSHSDHKVRYAAKALLEKESLENIPGEESAPDLAGIQRDLFGEENLLGKALKKYLQAQLASTSSAADNVKVSLSSLAIIQLAKTVAKKLLKDYRGVGVIRKFLKEGKMDVWSKKISLLQYLTKIGIELSNINDWREFVEEVWLQARLKPDELQKKVEGDLEIQKGLIREQLSKDIKDFPVHAIKGIGPQLYILDIIDEARRITNPPTLADKLKDKANMDEYVELPAQRLVRDIFKNGGKPYLSNAYGPGLKGVFWEKDGVDYFTPLTIENYKTIDLEQEKLGQIKIPEAWAGSIAGDVETSSSIVEKTGGIAFNALPIRTEAVASSVLGSFPGVKAFQGDLDAEWAQIQQVFNAGIRPSVQRISEYTAAAASSGLAGEKIDQARGMLADILRRDEEDARLPVAEPALKNLITALES